MLALEHHREQSTSDRCVPACAAMVRSWLGRPLAEEELCQGWFQTKGGYDLADAAHAIGGTLFGVDPDSPRFYDDLAIRLAEPRWLIAYMFSALLMRFTQAFVPQPRSRFGALATKPYGELHAVVLVEADATGFLYLDPYYPVTGQPFRLSRTQLAQVWQGRMAISPSRTG
jgi:hypothetical protein